jgi:predicted nucleic acid-binding protein
VIVLDASVIVKWLRRGKQAEDSTLLASALIEDVIEGRTTICQPVHWLVEVAGVIARLSPATADFDVLQLQRMRLPVADDPILLQVACRLALRHRVHVLDSLYHAVALENEGATLVTADEAYFHAARKSGRIALLQQWRAH